MPEETQDQEPQRDNNEAETDQEDTLPENIVSVEDAGTLKKKVTVTVQRQRIDAKFEEMYGELSRSAQVPGFRIGRAPRRLIEKRFSKDVAQDVRNALIGEAIGPSIEKADLKTIGQPDVDLDKIELPESGEMSFDFEVEVEPEFDLPELKGIKIEQRTLEITPQRVDERVDQWRQLFVRHEATDTPAEVDDVIAAKAKISGEDIDPVKTDELTLRVAPGQIEGLPLVDLGKVLAGKKAGEKAELTIKVPEAHPNEDWRGKELKVEVEIIQVRRRILPELNEDFARNVGYESLEELRELVSRNLEAGLKTESQQQMRDQVCEYLLKNTKLDVPEGVASRHTARLLQRRYVDLLQRGVPKEKIDENLTKLQAAATEQAQRDLKLSFVLGKVAEAEGMEVNDEEINSRIAEMAVQYKRRPDRLRQELSGDGSLEQIGIALLEEKALDKLIDQADVTKVAAEKAVKKKTVKKRPKAAKKSKTKKDSKKN